MQTQPITARLTHFLIAIGLSSLAIFFLMNLVGYAGVKTGVPYPDAPQFGAIEDQDWVRLTRSQFRPIHIAERLWIVPSWESAPQP